MKVVSVKANNKKKAFEIKTGRKLLLFPYVKADLTPTTEDPIARVYPDEEIGKEGFSYELASGKNATIHIEQVLEYNQDPAYLRDLLLYRLTVEAQKRVASSRLAKREIIRRLRTSATQFYRLLDQTNYDKSVDQLIALLQILDCEIDLIVRAKSA
jgi:hypothetical protein